MPNHITNRLYIRTDDTALLERILSEIKGEQEDQLIDFNKFVAIPDELKGTVSPMRIISQEAYDEQEKELAKGEIDEKKHPFGISRSLTKELSDKYRKEFGADNWYDWQCDNWGTKWNAYDQFNHGDGEIEFNTAWSTPFDAMVHLSTKYPDVEFFIQYADEDFGYNVGEYTLVNGEETETFQPDGGSIEALKLAMEIKGDEDFYLGDNLIDQCEDEISEHSEMLIQIAHEKNMLNEDYPPLVLERLKELAILDEDFDRVIEIDKLLAQPKTEE